MGDHDGRGGIVFWPPKEGGIGWFVALLAFIALVGGLVPMALGLYYGTVQRHLEFVIGPDGLVASYKVGQIVIAAQDIAAVHVPERPPGLVRVSGAGLGDFQMGWYKSDEHGLVYRLTTGGSGCVFVDVADAVGPDTTAKAGGRYVFSPENPKRFADLLEQARAGTGPGSQIAVASFPGRGPSPRPLVLLGLVLGLTLGVGMPWALLRSKRQLRYVVGPDGITVLHLGRTLYRWSDIRHVTVRHEPLKGLLRTFGTSLPGYYAGKFSARGLRNLQMNATRKEPPFVVVQTDRAHLVITPEDTDGFMAAVDRHRPPA